MSKRPLLVIFVTVFVDLLGFGIVLPLLAVYAEKLNASSTTVAVLAASFSVMQFLFAPLWGRLSDRIGRKPVLILGLLGSVIFYGIFGYASLVGSIALLFVSRIGAGIAGATISTAQAYIADSTPPERRTSGMAIIGAAFAIGMTFGPLIGGVALMQTDVAGSSGLSPLPGYLAAGISGIALLLAIFVLPESLKEGSRTEKTGWMNLANLRLAVGSSLVASLLLIGFVAVFAFAKFESTLSLLCKEGFGYADTQIYYIFTYIGITLTLAQGFLVRRLAKKVPEKAMSLAGILAMGVGMAGLVWAAAEASTPLLLGTLPILVVGFALLSTSVQGWLSRASRQDQQGGILGINQSLAALARILGFYLGIKLLLGGPLLLGSLQLEKSMTRPYLVSMVLMAIVLGLVLLLPKPPASSESSTSA